MPDGAAQTSSPVRRPSPRRRLPTRRPAELTITWTALDLAVAAELEREIVLACDRHPRRLILNLVDVEFMDASGLHALGRARERLRARGTRLTLRGLGPQPRRLLQLVAMTDAFDVDGG